MRYVKKARTESVKKEIPAPPPPSAGKPNQPYMKIALSGAFSASMPSETHMVTRGRDTAALREMKERAPMLKGKAIAVQNMYWAVMRATSPLT